MSCNKILRKNRKLCKRLNLSQCFMLFQYTSDNVRKYVKKERTFNTQFTLILWTNSLRISDDETVFVEVSTTKKKFRLPFRRIKDSSLFKQHDTYNIILLNSQCLFLQSFFQIQTKDWALSCLFGLYARGTNLCSRRNSTFLCSIYYNLVIVRRGFYYNGIWFLYFIVLTHNRNASIIMMITSINIRFLISRLRC